MTIETLIPQLDADWSPGGTPAAARLKKLPAFLRLQRERLLELRGIVADSVAAGAQVTRENRIEASPSALHPADAGSDAYDRDFALGLLSHDQSALAEIDQALHRIERGTYGICEFSGQPIPRPRLEALPFARYTVERQAQLEKEKKASRGRHSIQSIFLPDDLLQETKEFNGELEPLDLIQRDPSSLERGGSRRA